MEQWHSIPGISSGTLHEAIKRRGHLEVEYVPDKSDVVRHLVSKLRPGEIVLTLGAGDIYKVAEELVETLEK